VERASRPSRARGLKLINLILSISRFVVAPFAGAWIETNVIFLEIVKFIVAPFAGAWIETDYDGDGGAAAACRALRGRVD